MNKQDIVINWLNKEFGNLTEVVRDDRTFYVDKDRKPLFMYFQDSKNGVVYVNYERIWIF
jgi:predicted lipoprotein with Yx(FWY)xxD motif